MTSASYIKRSNALEYRKQNRGGKGKRGMATREEDIVKHLVLANTHDFLLFFTDKGRVFRMKTYEIPASGLTTKGVAIVNLLQLQPDEVVTSIIRSDSKSESGYLFMCTLNGVVKKTAVEAYKNVRSSGMIAINLDEKDELRWVTQSDGTNEVIITTQQGQAIRFHENNVRAMGRVSRGVRGIRLRKDDRVIGMDIVNDNASIFVLSKNGYGKRTKVAQFTPHARGGVGIRSAVVNSKTGQLIGVASLNNDASQEIIIISTQGQTIRLGLNDISEISRATQGVRVMRLNGDDTVASIGLVDAEEPEETDEDKSTTEKDTKSSKNT